MRDDLVIGSDETRLRQAGFRWGSKGTHTSRTIMLDELRAVFGACGANATRTEYLAAIQDDNCLGKRTTSTRKLSGQRLSELYALDPDVPLFVAMRICWYADPEGQPLIAILMSLARDPLLRSTAATVLDMRAGEELARQRFTDAIDHVVGSRLNEETVDKVVRNTASSWTQSGHFTGRGRKIRRRVAATAASTAFALLIGYVTGTRGAPLFESLWARVLDASNTELVQLAADARRLGLLDFTHSGGIIDLGFSRLLPRAEKR